MLYPFCLFLSLITLFTKHFGALLSSLVSPEWSVSIRNQALTWSLLCIENLPDGSAAILVELSLSQG